MLGAQRRGAACRVGGRSAEGEATASGRQAPDGQPVASLAARGRRPRRPHAFASLHRHIRLAHGSISHCRCRCPGWFGSQHTRSSFAISFRAGNELLTSNSKHEGRGTARSTRLSPGPPRGPPSWAAAFRAPQRALHPQRAPLTPGAAPPLSAGPASSHVRAGAARGAAGGAPRAAGVCARGAAQRRLQRWRPRRHANAPPAAASARAAPCSARLTPRAPHAAHGRTPMHPMHPMHSPQVQPERDTRVCCCPTAWEPAAAPTQPPCTPCAPLHPLMHATPPHAGAARARHARAAAHWHG